MKITDFKVLRANRAVYCKIYTDEGIVGLGESGAWGFLEASAQAMITMSEYLIGKNPLDIEHHWQYLYRFSHFRGAAVMGARGQRFLWMKNIVVILIAIMHEVDITKQSELVKHCVNHICSSMVWNLSLCVWQGYSVQIRKKILKQCHNSWKKLLLGKILF